MKTYDVVGNVKGAGEYILGSRETGSHACYLIYGVLKPGEQGRELKPGHGHEEIMLALKGDLQIAGPELRTLHQGQAMHLKGEETLSIGNQGTSEAIYVIAGGHSEAGHH